MRNFLLLIGDIGVGKVGLLSALMVAAALTEGIGIVSMVPLLAVLGDVAPDGMAGRIMTAFSNAGLPLSIAPLLAFFVLVVGLRALLVHGLSVMQMRTELALVDHWRERLFDAAIHAEWRRLAQIRQADLTSTILTGVDRIGMGFAQVVRLFASGVTVALLLLAALALSPAVALAGAVAGAAVLAAFARTRRHAGSLGQELGQRHRALQAVIGETLPALRIVKSEGREVERIAALRDAALGQRNLQYAYTRSSGLGRMVLHTLGAATLALAVWVGIRQGVEIVVLLPLVLLFVRSLPLLDAVQQALQRWAFCAPALADAHATLSELHSYAEAPLPATAAPIPSHTIAMENVTLSQPGRDRPVIDDVTVNLPVGTITALVGPSGAGKSTLADLFGGLLFPDEGALTLDGQPLGPGQTRAWRRRVAYVHQQPILFHGTIGQNLRWAVPDADVSAMEVALERASASFVFDLPEGLETMVGDAGTRLSGGERQRISLARAMLRKPSLLILDEATSAVDRTNEAQMAAAIRALSGHVTVLVIGHRGLLTEQADHTATLEAGRLVSSVAT